VNYN